MNVQVRKEKQHSFSVASEIPENISRELQQSIKVLLPMVFPNLKGASLIVLCFVAYHDREINLY